MFTIISVYPVLNFVIIKDFIDEFNLNIEELSLTYLIKGNVALNYGVNYLRTSLIMQEINDLKPSIDAFLLILNKDNQNNLDDLALLAKNFNGINRYGME